LVERIMQLQGVVDLQRGGQVAYNVISVILSNFPVDIPDAW